jgi:DNA invertase Pin-like site-specific DNA recombinase
MVEYKVERSEVLIWRLMKRNSISLGNKYGFGVYPEHHANGQGAKLNEKQIIEFTQDKLNGMTYKELGAKYNICQSTVFNYSKKYKARMSDAWANSCMSEMI